jgi:uncharacterized protein (DUF1778 family)
MMGTDSAALAAASRTEEVVVEMTLVRMSPPGFGAFMAAVETPAAAVPELIELFKRRVPWAGSAD